MKEILQAFKSSESRRRIVISAVWFFAVSAPFQMMLSLIPGVTEVRPANMLPVVLGLIWGPAGAIGIVTGELISDIFIAKLSPAVCACGFFVNFFYAYLPYKLWYSDGSRGEIRLESVNQIVKFVYIAFLDSVVVSTFLAFLFDFFGFAGYEKSFGLLFFNNFDFSLILGVPVILILSNIVKIDFYKPELAQMGENQKERRTLPYRMYKKLLWGVSVFGYLFFVLKMHNLINFDRMYKFAALIIIGFILVLSFKIPYRRFGKGTKTLENNIKISIRARLIIGFLMLSIIFVLVIAAATYFSIISGGSRISRVELWKEIFFIVGLALNIIFLVSIVFLKYIEEKISNPIAQLTGLVEKFAKLEHSDIAENNSFLKEYPKIKTGDELELLSDSFLLMTKDINEYVSNIEKITKEKERIGAELGVANQIQANMLPRIFPPFPNRKEFDLYASMHPAKEVGGDFYDYFLIDEDHLAIVIADVSGKGVPAALFMVIAKTLIKNRAVMGGSPAEILEWTNNQLCENNDSEMFVTVWLGILEISTGLIKASNAGHEYPLIKEAGGEYRILKDRHGMVLGGIEDMKYEDYEIRLSPGASIFVYTDGVPEAMNREYSLFGMEGMLKSLNGCEACELTELLDRLKSDIDSFADKAEQFDDITMLCLRYYSS